MNITKPGTIAMVVRDTTAIGCVGHMVGTPIETEHLIDTWMGPAWAFKGPPLRCPACGSGFVAFFGADLQPLRPGPEKTDTSDSRDIRSGEVAQA